MSVLQVSLVIQLVNVHHTNMNKSVSKRLYCAVTQIHPREPDFELQSFRQYVEEWLGAFCMCGLCLCVCL